MTPRIALTRDGLSLSRLVFGAWRLLDDAVRRDADAVARLIGTAVDLGLTSFSLRRPSLPCRAFLPV